MRRRLSVLLILFFGLWPLSGMLEASDDARLPACCRRHGTHHCAMSLQLAAAAASTTPALSAPPTCPLFPGLKAGASIPAHALAASAAEVRGLAVQERALTARSEDALVRPVDTRSGRGPPESPLS